MSMILPPGKTKDVDDAVRTLGPDAVKSEIERKVDPFNWLEEFELTDAEIAEIRDQRWVVEGLLPEGHITAICGRAGAGKTSILFHEACTEVISRGYNVIYVHSDTYPAEAKEFTERARAAGVRYLTPDIKRGASMMDVLTRLKQMADAGESLRGWVIYFDTLKKLAAVIQKSQMAELMKVLRKLSGRGATIVLLGHVNKHKGDDGNDVFEGVGDLQNDSDNLLYFVATKEPNGLLVSAICDPSEGIGKMRAMLRPISWQIRLDRTVARRDEFIDTIAIQKEAAQRTADEVCIDAVREALQADKHTQLDITTYCSEHYRLGEKRVRSVLKRWEDEDWRCERRAYAQNRKWYELLDSLPPCQTDQTDRTDSRKCQTPARPTY